MIKLNKSYLKFINRPQGHLLSGDDESSSPCISALIYNDSFLEEKDVQDFKPVLTAVEPDHTVWFNVVGKPDSVLINYLKEQQEIHPLLIEDILSPLQHQKVESLGGFVLIILSALSYHQESSNINSFKISVLIRGNQVISFVEEAWDPFFSIKDRILNNRGIIRRRKADFLVCALMDCVVDGYYPVLHALDDAVSHLEDIDELQHPHSLEHLYGLKKQAAIVRRTVRPLLGSVSELIRQDDSFVSPQTVPFFRDIEDHIRQIDDFSSGIKDSLLALVDLLFSLGNERLNSRMKFLTIVSTIFIPLTFIAGIYGMNFEHMPELGMPLGYFFTLGGMGLTALSMILIFKIKKWF